MGEDFDVEQTTELRWFGDGDLPDSLRDVMADRDAHLERRQDVYLRTVDDSLLVKVRDGRRLEVKRRVGGHRQFSYGNTIRGRVDDWIKWSFGGADMAPEPDLDPRHWIAVNKIRRVVDVEPAASGDVEFSLVGATAITGWSVCIELAQTAHALTDLRQVVKALKLDRVSSGLLTADASSSYAAWLSALP